MCTPVTPPSSPLLLWGSWCVSAFLSSLGVYTQIGGYVKCVACEFSADVECVLPTATAKAPRRGRPGVWAEALG